MRDDRVAFGHPTRIRLAWLLAPALAVLVAVLVLELAGFHRVRDWPLLVAVFNALFCTAPAAIIAFLAARDHLASGSVSLLLFGPASMVFGLAYLMRGLFEPDTNLSITIHNIGVLFASLLFAVSAVFSLLQRDLPGRVGDRAAALVFAYLATLAIIAVVALATVAGAMPDFYGSRGVTITREFALSLAVVMFLATGVIFAFLYSRRADRFLLMCASAFVVIGVSFAVLVLSRAPAGSATVWLSRAGQWMGGVCLLVGVLSLTGRRILPLRDFEELQERYRTLVELSPDPIVVDADGYFLFANPAAARLLGLPSPEALIGRPVEDFVAPEYVEPVTARRVLAERGRPASPQEIRMIRTDGTIVDLETMDRRVMLGGRTAVLVILRDITQRKQVEEALRDSEERHRQLAQENENLYRQQLEIAQSLQSALLNLPSAIGRVRLGHRYHSATETARVGGDFYDVFEVRGNHIAVLIGDVAGHGIQAARTATLVKDFVHAFTHQSPRPREVLRRTNRVLAEKEVPGFFVTVFLAVIDAETGVFQYSSAGHPSTLIRRTSGHVDTLEAGTPPLGIFPEADWTMYEERLAPGDVLLTYTDGVIETRRDGEFFGEDRLRRLLGREHRPVEELPAYLLRRVLAFSRGVLKDDVAVLALSLAPSGADEGGEGHSDWHGWTRLSRPE